MMITTEQIEFIELDIRLRGIESEELAESMVDHICCQIENSDHDNFHEAYSIAIHEFGNTELGDIQHKISHDQWYRKYKSGKKLLYIMGFIAMFITSTGLLFKVMHWPGAGIALLLGAFILNLGFLPLYFYDRYKQSISK